MIPTDQKKKYELLTDDFIISGDKTVYRIKALICFGDVSRGALGGYIESEDNLSQCGDCWVYDDSVVRDTAHISDNAQICNYSIITGNCSVRGNAVVEKSMLNGNADVYDNAYVCESKLCFYVRVYGNAQVTDSQICKYAKVYGDCEVSKSSIGEQAELFGHCKIEQSTITGHVKVYDNALVKKAHVYEYASVYGDAKVMDGAEVGGFTLVNGSVSIEANTQIIGDAVVSKLYDYMVFKNCWSSGKWITWTRYNDMWKEGDFYGTGEELIKKAYSEEPKTAKFYKLIVKMVEDMCELIEELYNGTEEI